MDSAPIPTPADEMPEPSEKDLEAAELFGIDPDDPGVVGLFDFCAENQ